MLTTLISFFGGNVFRMLWGEVSAMITARQDHRFEIERMRVQAELEAAQHARNLEAIKQQADLGVQTIRVQGEQALQQLDGELFREGVLATTKPSGIWWVDAWNGCIRPLLATIAIGLWVMHLYRSGWTLDEYSWGLIGAVLGIYVADRTLFKRGK